MGATRIPFSFGLEQIHKTGQNPAVKYGCIFISTLIATVATATEQRFDIEYARTQGTPLHLDVSIPDGKGPFPVAILVHGGGWSSGNKRAEGDIQPLMAPLNQAGFVWFSIDYRLAPSNHWPACIEDVQCAIRWVKAHANEFNGDSNRVALVGYSAGGHLACLAAVLADDTTRVQAVVGCAAPTDHIADSERRGGLSKSMQAVLNSPADFGPESRQLLRNLSPINYVKPGLPPFLLLGGTEDKSVPYSQSVNFQARLQAAGVETQLITLTNAPHRLGDWKKFDPDYQTKLIHWLKTKLGSNQNQ
ncbi:MAG: hypothetical protein RLY20_1919 [Verrucomicrobiota bacterium]